MARTPPTAERIDALPHPAGDELAHPLVPCLGRGALAALLAQARLEALDAQEEAEAEPESTEGKRAVKKMKELSAIGYVE